MLNSAAPGRPGFRFGAFPLPKSGYRADIDGLRALAVLPVVLFHARLGPFTGGFVGVDVFFVISGYLITQLIVADVERGRFSIAHFYERRVRRLFPALFAMLAVAAVAGALLFLPADFRNFGRNVVGATMFVSNIFFWLQSNYFDGPAEIKPLLHTWSLAVEEQFYIVFPLLLVWLLRRRREGAVAVIAAIAVASFLASVVMVARDASTAFYLTPFRVWELMIGSLLALGAVPPLRSAREREIAAGLGLALILAAAVGYSEMTVFPGSSALLPCLGAALIIHSGSGEGSTAVGRALSSRPAVFIGAISYSIYLWHWPLIVFAGYYLIHEPSTGQAVALVAVSLAMGALSWRFIEVPFRKPGNGIKTPLFVAAGTAMACAVIAGTSIYVTQGFPQRFSARVDAISDFAQSVDPRSDRCVRVADQLAAHSGCTIGNAAEATQMLWGDSHAGALFGAFDEIAKDGPSTVYAATPRCPPLLGVGTSEACIDGNARRLEFALSHPEVRTVILAARWSLYVNGRATENGPAERNGNLPTLRTPDGRTYAQFSQQARAVFRSGLDRLVDRLLASGKHVVLVYPVPETGYDIPSTLARMSSQGRNPASFTTPLALFYERQHFARDMLDDLGERPGLSRVRPMTVLCRGPRCLASIDGEPLYFDSHHLSIPGARLLVPELRKAIGLEHHRRR